MILLWQNDQESRLLLLVLQMKKVKENQMLQVHVAMKKFGVKNCTNNFNPQWLEEFSWLVFEEGAMFCKFCYSAGEGMAGKSQFVTGKHNFKRNNHEHRDSRHYATCRDAHITKSQPDKPEIVTAAFNRVESRSKEEEARQMKIKFNIAYISLQRKN